MSHYYSNLYAPMQEMKEKCARFFWESASIHCMDARQQAARMLQEAFERSGKKQKAIGLEIGRSEATVSRYASGHTVPSGAVVRRLEAGGYISKSDADRLKELVDQVEEEKVGSVDPNPLQALKARFQEIESRYEALESQLLALRQSLDSHTRSHT